MNDSLILTLCLQENTLLISNAIIEQLGSPSLIQIRMNEADKSLLVNPCEYGVRGAVVVPGNRMYQLEMPDRSLIRRIQRITEWPDDNPRVLYGVFIPQLNAIYFSLDTAQLAILQPVPDTPRIPTDDSSTPHIPTYDSSTLPTREGPEACIDGGDGEAVAPTREGSEACIDGGNAEAVAPTREGPEACIDGGYEEAVTPPLTGEGDTGGAVEKTAEAPAVGEGGDLNG